MTLDEAIAHCWDVADTCNNKECGMDHKQLASWLMELRNRRQSSATKMIGWFTFKDPNDINTNMFLSPEEKEKYGFENYFSPDQIVAIVPAQTDTYYFCFFKYTPMDSNVQDAYLDRWVKRERAKDKTESS